MIVLYILLAIVVLLLMIMIHETGHYIAGKILKFEIEEFSIGFGPAIFSKKLKSGEIFSLRWIPLGGYCAFKGEDEDDDDDEVDDIDQKSDNVVKESQSTKDKTGCFNTYACWKRLIVLFSGAFLNFVSAILFTLILLVSVGSGMARVEGIYSDSVNKDVLQVNDIIMEVDGKTPTFLNGGIVGLMADKGVDEEIVLKIKRDGTIIDGVKVKKYQQIKYKEENGQVVKDEEGNPIVVKDDNGNPVVIGTVIGIDPDYVVPLSFGEAIVQCVPYTFNMAWECIKILGQLITGGIGIETVGGPITTVQTIAVSTQESFKNLILLFPLIAVNLAVFNLLPIPALDGARMVFVLIEWIFRKPVPRNIEAKIHSVGMFVLFGLVIVIDLLHLFLF